MPKISAFEVNNQYFIAIFFKIKVKEKIHDEQNIKSLKTGSAPQEITTPLTVTTVIASLLSL